MLKSCWDCLVGYDLMRDGTRAEEPYGVQLNGNLNRAPPWPRPQLQNEKMFILPKILGTNDHIKVRGETSYDRSQLTVGLVTGFNSPDYSNVACQLTITYNDTDKIELQIIENGGTQTIQEELASDYFDDPGSFEISFIVRSPEILAVFIGQSQLGNIQLKHDVNNIRYLNVHGDVSKVSSLDFSFG